MESSELKIELHPDREPRYTFDKLPISKILPKKYLAHSLNENQQLGYLYSNVPVLCGFYEAHTNHYPIRIKPDDIWLLIVQGFSNHVNANSEELRSMFVNFEGKKTLIVKYPLSSIEEVDEKILENFSGQINKQMIEYLGEEIVNTLTADFSTTTYDSKIVSKISIMGAFKKYFDYRMHLCGCGVPYLILEGTAEDYRKIIEKANKLKKYKFDWYINRIIPHITKMAEAKEGKIDKEYFKNMIQKEEITQAKYGLSGMYEGEEKVEYLYGWFLEFFAYDREGDKYGGGKLRVDCFKELAKQMLIVPFKIVDLVHNKEYDMKYDVGFVGCEQNDKKEVYPVQGWIVSPSSEKDRNSLL